MEKQAFEVKYKRSDNWWLIISCLPFIIILAFMYYIGVYQLACIILTAFFAVTIPLAIIASLTFYLKVENDIFYIRQRFGKKYELSLLQLKAVRFANNYTSKVKHNEQILLDFGETSVIILSDMSGMQEFTGYMLEKYENGEISKQVIQRCDYETLKEYQEEYIKKNEKNKKRSHTI